jgi:WD40 repeat protein
MTALAGPGLLDRLRVVGPYKGLAPFDDSDLDALLFFGRDLEREVIEANLFASRLTVLYGQTGVGKSSLLRAGLVHALRDHAERNRLLQGHPDFAVVLFDRWNGEPVEDLAAATHAALASLFGEEVVELPRDEPLAEALDRWTRELDTDVLLVLDQAEEYFLYHGGGSFEAQLPEIVTRPLRANVLLSLREDQLAKLDRFKGRIPNLFANYLRVDHLDPRAATAAILQPLERYNELTGERIEIEPALVDAILEQTLAGKVDLGRVSGTASEADTGPVRVEAPYLQLVLQRIWQEERAAGSNTLRLETLTALGGADEIARTHLERALGQLDEPGRDVAASVFLHLVTPSGTKIALPVGDLAEYTGTPSDELEPVLHMLARERILKPVETPNSDTANGSFEIFHDVLGEAVLAWRARHTERRALEHERRESRRRHRRLVGLFGIAIAAFAVMTAVAAYAVNQRQEADKQARIAAQKTQVALKQTALTEAALAEAKKNAQEAAASEKKANDALEVARQNEDEAERNAAEAEQNAQAASAAEARADDEARQAQRSANEAKSALAVAEVATQRAQRNARVAHQRTLEAQREKTRAKAGAFAAQALALIPENPESAVELALKAVKLERTQRAEDVLRDAYLALRVRAVFRPGSGAVREAVFDGSAEHLLVAGTNGLARLYTVGTRKHVDFNHDGRLLDAALTTDGRYVATAGGTSVRIWNAADGRLEKTIEQGSPPRAIDFSPNGSLLVTLDAKRARVWRVPTGEPVAVTLAHPTALVGAVFNPAGTLFVTFDAGPQPPPLPPEPFARVFRADTGELVHELEHAGVVVGARWDPTGKVLFTGGRRNGYIWITTTWERLQLLEAHTRPIRDAAFSPDGERLVTVGDHVGRMWRVSDGKPLLSMPGSEHELVAAAFSPDGDAVLTGGKDGVGRIWAQTGNGKPAVAYGGHSDTVTHVAYSPDGKYAMTASLDGTARLWDPTRDPQLRAVGTHDPPPPPPPDSAPEVAFTTTAFAPDGKLILSAGADGTARLWRPNGKAVLNVRHGGRVTRALLIRSGSLIVTASDDGTAKVWRVKGARLLATMNHGSPIRALAVAGKDGLIVTAGDDGNAHVWTLAGRPVRTLHHGGSLLAVAINAAATRVVTAGTDNTAIVWEPRTGRRIKTLSGHGDDVTTVAFDRTGLRVATGAADGDARLWTLATGDYVDLAGNPESLGITTVRFNPKGDLLLTAYENGDVRTWHTRTGKIHKRFNRHVSVVADASFSRDGEWIVTAGPSAAGIWQTRTGKLLFFYRGMTAPLTSAAFGPDSHRFVTAGQDGVVRIGLCQVCTGIDELKTMANRRLEQIVRPERPKPAR